MSATLTPGTRPKKIRIGDLLIEHKIISQEQLTAALADQKKSGRKLGRVLIENGYLTEDQLLDFLARQLNIVHIDLKRYHVKPDTVRLIPEVHARRFRVLALDDTRDGLLVGMADPTDIFAYDELTRVLRKPLKLAVVREADLLKTIDLMYRRTAEISGLAQALEQELSSFDVDIGALAANEALTDAPVVKLLQTMFEDAVQVNASDIHIEPDERELRIRFRQDGVLRVQTVGERKIGAALVSRLKLMAGLDISEKRLPQDGRFNVKVRDKGIDVRLSTLPVQYGESAVMRLLNQSTGVLALDDIGMSANTLERFRKLVHSPHGVVLVTGPTGSGKTTTLYSALKELNQTSHKVVTVEDPVEYRLSGINQVQVNSKIDLSFARVLRSVLRQDPDIILVGEIRDAETAEIALRAAMTGHLVLSTLHTNDAISTAARLMDMGAEPYLIAASLRGVIAQRLVRRVCEACSEPYEPDANERALLQTELGKEAESLQFKRGRGCTYCNSTGYQGRIGVYELLEMTEPLIESLHGGSALRFAQTAHAQPGYQSLKRSAIDLAARGLTTLEQVVRVTYGADQ
jgi:MSHA biogenesis protein MshE